MLLLQFFSIALAQFSNELCFRNKKFRSLKGFLFTSDWNFLLIWAYCKCFGMCANNKYNCLQFAQQLIAYGLLSKTDESILT